MQPANLEQRSNTCCNSQRKTLFPQILQIMFVCQISRQTGCTLSSFPDSRKQPISYRKHLSGKKPDSQDRRSPPPAPKTSGIYDKIADISKMRKKRTADWPDYHSEHLTEENSGNRLLSLLRREVIPLCHRNNDNKKEECISYIPLFRPELFRKKSPVTVKNTCRASPLHSTSAPGNRTDDAESSPATTPRHVPFQLQYSAEFPPPEYPSPRKHKHLHFP